MQNRTVHPSMLREYSPAPPSAPAVSLFRKVQRSTVVAEWWWMYSPDPNAAE
jgi:hypothetical protein